MITWAMWPCRPSTAVQQYRRGSKQRCDDHTHASNASIHPIQMHACVCIHSKACISSQVALQPCHAMRCDAVGGRQLSLHAPPPSSQARSASSDKHTCSHERCRLWTEACAGLAWPGPLWPSMAGSSHATSCGGPGAIMDWTGLAWRMSSEPHAITRTVMPW